MNEQERAGKAKLWGALQIPEGNTREPDSARLHESLDRPQSAMYVFCTHCGTTMEVTRKGAEMLAKKAGATLPEFLEPFYFRVSACVLCSPTKGGTVELAEKPPQQKA